MNKQGRFDLDFEAILALAFLLLTLVFFTPFFLQLGLGNYESALAYLLEIFVPLIFMAFIIDVLRRFFTW